MVEITAPVQHRHWQDRVLPPVERVRDGLWSLPVPMPGYGLRYLLAYVLELPDGIALVDTGWTSEQAWQGLVDGLASIGFGVRDVRAVLATHVHTDHYGLAGRLRAESGAWLGIHPADAVWSLDPEHGFSDDAWRRQRIRLGLPDRGARGNADAPWREAYSTRPDLLIEDGDRIDLPGWQLRAVWTPGHSPGHLCFHAEDLGLLFAGDHVLPKVTPHISITSLQRPDPLADYLGSLAAVAELSIAEVLPAHEYRYAGLRERAEDLIAHHEARLAEIEDTIAAHPGSTCWQLTKRLTWSRPLDQQPPALRRTAVRETAAHLVLLANQGRARSEGDAPQLWWIP